MSVVFFDLDDTIYDRAVPFCRTFAHFFGETHPQLALKAYQTCSARGNEVFEPSQTGAISMEEMYIYRYQKGLADVGIAVTDHQALDYQKFYGQMQKKLQMTTRMEEILTCCKSRFDSVGIITNGPAAHQRQKMDCLGLEKWVRKDLIFISGEQGITKPNPRIFERAALAAQSAPSELIYVGDSYETDIAVPAAMGWSTIWLNRKQETVPEGGYVPDAVVSDEAALLACLKVYGG